MRLIRNFILNHNIYIGMSTKPSALSKDEVTSKLKQAGLRPTVQRVALGCLIWKGEHRHLTAEDLFNDSRVHDIKVSLATIYNTLHQFTNAGLLKEIVVEGGRSYFDTNIDPHHHFMYEDSGELEDIPGQYMGISGVPTPPEGTVVTGVEVVVKIRRQPATA